MLSPQYAQRLRKPGAGSDVSDVSDVSPMMVKINRGRGSVVLTDTLADIRNLGTALVFKQGQAAKKPPALHAACP